MNALQVAEGRRKVAGKSPLESGSLWCEVCDGLGIVTCECGDPEHECGEGEEVECGRCDGTGEVEP